MKRGRVAPDRTVLGGSPSRWRWRTLSELLGSVTCRDRDDISPFSSLDASRFELLVAEGFIDLDRRWNDAPTAREFLEFMRRWPWVRAHGYAVHPARRDFRVTIEGLECDLADVPTSVRPALGEAFASAFAAADELETGDCLWAWWD